jgi:chlorobactene lauroyltransferase
VKSIPDNFIPPKIDWFTITFFKWYVKYLCKKRFKHVWLRSNYEPDKANSTLFLLNHNYWWDGLIPLLLNEFVFHQRARAIMEDKQVKKYSFFSRIGAISIDRSNLKSALFSLDYAGKWLESSGNSLYLYPEGKITNPCDELTLESGFTRILKNYAGFDIVIIALHISYDKYDKPELHIDVSKPLMVDTELTKREIVVLVQHKLKEALDRLRDSKFRDEMTFIRLV